MRTYIVVGVMIVLLCMLYLVQKKEPYYQGGTIIGFNGHNLVTNDLTKDLGLNSYGWYKPGYEDGMYGSHCNALKLPNCVFADANNPEKCTKCILENPNKPWTNPLQLFIPNYHEDPSKIGFGGCKLNPVAFGAKYKPGTGYTCPAGARYDVNERVMAGKYSAKDRGPYLYKYVRCNLSIGDIIDRINQGKNEQGIDYSKIEALPSGNRDDIIAGYWTNLNRWDTDPTTFSVAAVNPWLPLYARHSKNNLSILDINHDYVRYGVDYSPYENNLWEPAFVPR